MAKITKEDVESRISKLSQRELADLESWSEFANDGDKEMADYIFSGFGKGLKTLIASLLSLKKTREFEEKD